MTVFRQFFLSVRRTHAGRISMSFFNEFNLRTLVYVIPFSFLCANFLRMTNENICLFLSLGVVGLLVVQV